MPQQTIGISGASEWIERLLGGDLILSLATLGILAVGFGLLTGRLSMRRGMATVIGCFIMFGAASIARVFLQNQAGPRAEVTTRAEDATGTPMAPKVVQKTNDPYAGSSLIPN